MGAHAKQPIYRFRGASSFNITRFGNADFAGATGKVGRRARRRRPVQRLTV